MPWFDLQTSAGTTKRVELTGAAIIVGRDTMCDLPLDDLKASRRHVRIYSGSEGKFFVEDLGSKNGTLVNGEPIKTRPLNDGDKILVGTSELVFRLTTRPAPPPRVILEETTTTVEAPSFATSENKLNLSRQRLEMIYDLSDRLTTVRERSELLEEVMGICFETLRFERGLIALKGRQGEPEWPVIRNLREDSTGQLTISRTILERALTDGERTILNDAALDMIDPTVSMARHHIRSAMCVPIKYGEEIMGVIYGDRVTSSTVYEREDVDFLAGLARQLSIGLMNGRLLEEKRQKALLESELQVARRIQTNLFPQDMPARDDLLIAAFNDPGRHVSGDFYDIIPFADGRVAVVIADVTGKGVAAALLMANLQAMVRLTLMPDADLATTVSRWNELLYANTDVSKFVTLIAGVIDVKARRFEYVNAGHLPPYVRRAGQVHFDMRSSACLPLGIEPTEKYQQLTYQAAPGETILLYTDGLPEAMNDKNEQFGMERIETFLAATPASKPQELIAGLQTQIRRFVGRSPQSDDITLLAAQVT